MGPICATGGDERMTTAEQTVQTPDSGAFALAVFLRLLGAATTGEQQAKILAAPQALKLTEILSRAREFGVTALVRNVDWDRLTQATLPAIAVLRNGEFLALGRIAEDGVVVVRPGVSALKPEWMSRADFETEWSGHVVLAQAPLAKRVRSGFDTLVGFVRNSGGALWAARAGAPEGAGADAPETFEPAGPTDASGLECLTLILGFHGVGVDPDQLKHRMGVAKVDIVDMLRAAKDMGLKAGAVTTRWDRLAHTPLPAIAALRDGSFLILGKAGDDKALIQRPGSAQPEMLTRDAFEEIWDGRLVLVTRRSKLTDLGRRFDITWFVGAMHKYRRLLGEVLIASFFLQLFALVSPLFFQVVIDKVLVQRSLSTLDVLIVGLVVLTFPRRCSAPCAPICSPTRPTASTSSSARGCSAICWRCRSPISRRGASATRWRGCANWRTSASSSPARR